MGSDEHVWTEVASFLPTEGQLVETKIDDADGTRNVQPLVRQGRLWWLEDRSMYVYYSPTRWRPISGGGDSE